MRGKDEQQLDVFSYVSPEQRVPQDHPLRSLRAMTDEALRDLHPRFNKLSRCGLPVQPSCLRFSQCPRSISIARGNRMLFSR